MIYIDTEFFGTTEENVVPVCAAVLDSKTNTLLKFWMLNDQKVTNDFKKYVSDLKEEVWFAYSVVAEGRYFLSSQLQPADYKWIDGFIEYRQITNHNDRMMYGPQLVRGKVRNTKRPPPKWKRTEEDTAAGFRPSHSLAEATYKLCGVVRDTEHKDLMRDIIISGDIARIEANKKDIMDYCVEDTLHLPAIYKGLLKEFAQVLSPEEMKTLHEEMLRRGRYSALTANMESIGYPINVEEARNFSRSVKSIFRSVQSEINDLFPDIKPFKWNKKDYRFSMNQKPIKEWVKENIDTDQWKKTDSGDISLSLEAWTKFFDFKHSYPKDSFGAQMVRYLKIVQNVSGFGERKAGSTTKGFWDYVGSDGRVRPYMNHYGAQSSRSQPASGGFLFLKPAWLRSLCQPAKGKAIGSFDYGSQEFLISALVSKDKNMIDAYASGDVYLAFAKIAGAVPKDGKRSDYEDIRDLFKATTLAVSYLMTKFGLAKKLTLDTGKETSEDEAQELIDSFYTSFPDFAEWQRDLIHNYTYNKEKIKLPCGWYLFTDNDNFRSAANAPIQGCAASIMRKAVELCYERGLKVVFTLHDAVYIEYDSHDMSAMDTLRECMMEAFQFYFEDKKSAGLIRLDGKVWSPDYTEDNFLIETKKGVDKKGKEYTSMEIVTDKNTRISASTIFVDPRASKEYEQFKKYFESTGVDLL